MTVAELISALAALPQDAAVVCSAGEGSCDQEYELTVVELCRGVILSGAFYDRAMPGESTVQAVRLR